MTPSVWSPRRWLLKEETAPFIDYRYFLVNQKPVALIRTKPISVVDFFLRFMSRIKHQTLHNTRAADLERHEPDQHYTTPAGRVITRLTAIPFIPVTTPPSILVVHGVTQTSEWYLDDLKKSDVLAASNAKLTLVNFDYGANPRPVIRALDSGEHNAAIVCDLSAEQSKFSALLGTALKRFVFQRAGRLAFPTTEGLLLNPVLKALFEVPWTEAAYYRTTWAPRPDAAARLDQTFPIRSFVPDGTAASALKFSAKACSYLNVPKEDRCYGVTDESQHESLSMWGAPSPSVGERTEDEPQGESEKSHVSVAMRQYGAGKLCYFGDVNCEKATADLVFAFCLA